MHDRMSPLWILIAAMVPIGVALLVAWPMWRRRVRDEGGAVAGATVVFAFSVAFIAREFGHVLNVSGECIARQVACQFEPEAFTRYAIYAAIGMLQVFVLFVVGLSVEERLRRA